MKLRGAEGKNFELRIGAVWFGLGRNGAGGELTPTPKLNLEPRTLNVEAAAGGKVEIRGMAE